MLRLILSVWFLGSSLSIPMNSSIFTPGYAKVAKWGATNDDRGEARGSGQLLNTHRSGQYGNSRIGSGKVAKIPGKGEAVIQDRFHPPPYFDYGVTDPKPDQDSKPAPVYSSPVDTFQPSDFQPGDPIPSYDSPISSYDPVASGVPKEADVKPSDDPYNSPVSSYNPAPSGVPSKSPAYQPTYGDSFEGNKGGKHKFPGYVYDPPMEDSDDDKYGGPYAPVDDSKPSHGAQDADDSKPSYGGDEGYMDHPPKYNHHDDADLTPPSETFPKSVPAYLDHKPSGHYSYDVPYNFNDHHHVYHEIKTTTTTEAPEDERVNKGHYSYYYLGRKLWYIPLYFSVYFIGYITVLILKSIARHKVNFAHDYNGKGRSLGESEIDETTSDVNYQMESFKRRYIAM